MKKILWTAGAYLVSVLMQLVCLIVFLIAQVDPLKKSVILSVLLLLSVVILLILDGFLKQEERAGRVDERLGGMLYLGQKQVSLLLSAGVLNLIVCILQGFWNLSLVVTGIAAICFLLACVVALIQMIRMIRPDEEASDEEEAEEQAPVPPQEGVQSDLNDGADTGAGEP